MIDKVPESMLYYKYKFTNLRINGDGRMEKYIQLSKQNMLLNETHFSEYACKSEQGIRFIKEEEDIRPMFFRDIDRIIHSLAYTRYIDKTQVYSFIQNDHITHRVLHVQLVSKIARTIGRSLRLNEDLIEAIALAHDVGHTPFGHVGENCLNEICEKENIGYFCHNAQGVRVLKDLEKSNISVQTLDGILAHNGEILLNKYEYNPSKTKEQFLDELQSIYTIKAYSKKIIPMTLEGCVVRISDIIAYIGRDIEDAIKVGSVKRQDIPEQITKVLGSNNTKIVNTLILDVIKNSIDKNYLTFTPEVFNALIELKKWNYKYIYNSKEATKNNQDIKEKMAKLYEIYVKDIKSKQYLNQTRSTDLILKEFIEKQDKHYIENTDARRIALDYISGQTDNFFMKEFEQRVGY